jgi:hypothetical protein
MKKLALATIVAVVFPVAVACNKPPEPIADKPASTTTTSSATPASPMGSGMGGMGAGPNSAATPAGPDDIAYDAPATWVSAPNPSQMRKATFKIPKAGGDAEDAELAISSASGGVEQNIKRWEQQFGDAKAKTEPRTVNGLKVTVVEIKGNVGAGGMMGMPSNAPKQNQMLLGAVVDGGDRQHFFKMVGGEKTVTAAKKDFDKFVSTFRAK